MAPRTQSKEYNEDDHPDDGGKLSPGPGRESFKLAGFWKDQIQQYDKANSRWHTRGGKVLKRFRDERNKLDEEGQRKMNLLWANYKVMKPAVYAKMPMPIVDRKFLDHDPTGRLSSQIMERSIINEIKHGFHQSVSMAVDDRLLPGRGIVWIRYEPQFGEGESIPASNPTGIEDELAKIGEDTGDSKLTEEEGEDEQLEETGETVVAEKVVWDYVDWKDFLVFPAKARVKAEIQAEAKKVYISRKEAKERFGDKIGSKMQPDTSLLAETGNKSTGYTDTAIFRDINERSIVVYEIWNKSDKRVYWVSPGYEYLCDVKDDPLELSEFFPARFISSTLTNDSLIPIPDYMEWQDLAIQIDELTARIASLSKACKVAGVYNAANDGIQRLLEENVENKLIPVDNWAMFAESGGLPGVISFLPLKEIQECIRTLQEVRQQAMLDLDQITGLSDVLRGTSDSRETLGGIRLKNNNAGTRLSETQEQIAEFCRDLIRMGCEVACKHFSDETFIESSGILYEEALQPDVVMREYMSSQPDSTPQQGTGGSQQQPQQQSKPGLPSPGGNVGGSLPPPMPQAPQGQAPQPGAPSNVVPFPGAQPGATQNQQPPGAQQGTPQPSINPLVPQLPPPDPQALIMMKVQKALALLRNDLQRGYRIDIEVDSTVFGDRMQEREDATEFITAVGQFMTSFQEIATGEPAAGPLLGKMLQWGIRKYRTGRDLEAEVDNFVLSMEKKAKQAANSLPQQSPEQIKAQSEREKHQMEMKKTMYEGQMQQQNDMRDAQKQQADDQREAQMQQAEDAREKEKMQLEMRIEREKLDMEREKMRMEMEMLRAKHHMEMQKLQVGAHVEMQKADVKGQIMQQEASMQSQQHQQELQQSTQQHHQTMEQQTKEHELNKESLQHKAKVEKQSHGLKMEQHKAKAQQQKQQAAQKKAKGAK